MTSDDLLVIGQPLVMVNLNYMVMTTIPILSACSTYIHMGCILVNSNMNILISKSICLVF